MAYLSSGIPAELLLIAGIAGVTLLLLLTAWQAFRLRRQRNRLLLLEREQRQSAAELARFFDLSLDLLCVADPEGRLRRLNSAWESAVGYPLSELTGQKSLDFVHPEDQERTQAAHQELSSSGATGRDFVNRYRRRDGSYRWIEWRSSASEGLIYAVGRDITERKSLADEQAKAAEHIRKARLLESVGRLAGGIAHDFNNLLTVINGYSDLLLSEMRPEDSRRSRVEMILKAGERAALLTEQLLAFSQKQIIQLQVLDLNTLVREEAEHLRALVGEKIVVCTALAKETVQIMADPAQIRQVLVSLASNARDAMPEGGQLVLETSRADLAESDLSEHPDAVPGPYALLRVSDTGSGMDPDTVQHLFEPFFTTKAHGRGKGLEMAMVYGVVRQNRGWISASSAPGQGTTLRICLPRMTAAARTQAAG